MLPLSILFFILTPLGSLPISLLGMIISHKNSKKYLLLFAMGVAIISFHLEPRLTDDGTRVLELIQYYSNLNFKQLLEIDKFYREPITHLLYFLVGKSGHPKLIFSIGGFLQYYALLYIVIDYANQIKASTKSRLQAILLILSYHSFFPAVGSFRYFTASALCLLAWYLLSMKNKKFIGILLSVIACLIHSGIYMQLSVLMITLLTWRFSIQTIWVKFGLIIWSMAYGFILGFLEKFSAFYLFEVSGSKLESYSMLNLFNYVQVILLISGLAMCMLFIYMAYQKTPDEQVHLERERSHNYYDLMSNYMFFSLGSVFVGHYIFRRLAYMAVLATAIPVLLYGLQKHKKTISFWMQNLVISLATLTGFFYSFRVVAAGFDVSFGELFVNNLLMFLYQLLF